MALMNGLSVDVEDYFHAEALSATIGRQFWESMASRVVRNTHRVLDLLSRHDTRATFFVLGWVALRFPQLVRDIHARGHELGCHSFSHRLVYQLTPNEFRQDTFRAKEAIEAATGVRVLGYRAPSFSITNQSLWALEVLCELGFAYDSSIFPIHHDIYGIPDYSRFSCEHSTAAGKIVEFPMSTWRVLGMNAPFGGGGYLRLLPLAYTSLAFRRVNEIEKRPVIVYFHPWEIDPGQPRVSVGPRSRLRHYTNLHKMGARVEKLLRRYQFVPLCELLPPQIQFPSHNEVRGE